MKNPMAKSLRTPRYRVRTIKPKKGKGSYDRKNVDRRITRTDEHSS